MWKNVWINSNKSEIILTTVYLTEVENISARKVDSEDGLNVIQILTTEQWNSLFLSYFNWAYFAQGSILHR